MSFLSLVLIPCLSSSRSLFSSPFFHLISGTWRSGVSVVFCCYTGWIFFLSLAVHHRSSNWSPALPAQAPMVARCVFYNLPVRVYTSQCLQNLGMNTSIIILKHGHLFFIFLTVIFRSTLQSDCCPGTERADLQKHFELHTFRFRIVKFIGGAVAKGVRLAQIYIMTRSAAALGWPGKWNRICLSLIFLPSHSHFLSLVPSLLHSFNNRPIIHTHFFSSLSRPWLLKNLVLERRHWHGLPDGEPHTHTLTHYDR